MIVDVRTPEEYEEGHHEGAVSIPLNEMILRDPHLPKGEDIAVYCASGARAHAAKHVLTQRGYSNVSLLNGTGAY